MVGIYRGLDTGSSRKGFIFAIHFLIIFFTYTLLGRWVMDTFDVDGDTLVYIFLLGIFIYSIIFFKMGFESLYQSLKLLVPVLIVEFIVYQLLLMLI